MTPATAAALYHDLRLDLEVQRDIAADLVDLASKENAVEAAELVQRVGRTTAGMLEDAERLLGHMERAEAHNEEPRP